MPYGKGYKRRTPVRRRRRVRNTPRKRPASKLLMIPRPIRNRLGNQVGMNLVTDFQIFIDPRLSAATPPTDGLQKSLTIQFCVNSVYPFLQATDQNFLISDPNQIINFDRSAIAYNRDTPNPSLASIASGVYNEGEYALGRKYEKAIITSAKVTCWATNVSFSSTAVNQQPGLLTLASHNAKVNPFGTSTNNADLNLVANRVTRRIEPGLLGGTINTKSRQVMLSKSVNIARANALTDIMDNREDFAFSLGGPTDTGTTAEIPNELNYISLNYTPSLKATMTGSANQAPPIVARVRLQQRIIFFEKRSHSNTAGVNWNDPKPYPLPAPSSGSSYKPTILGATMAGAYAYSRYRRMGRNYHRAIMG